MIETETEREKEEKRDRNIVPIVIQYVIIYCIGNSTFIYRIERKETNEIKTKVKKQILFTIMQVTNAN